MKYLIIRASFPLAQLAALAALIFSAALLQAQTLTLKDADTVEGEFRVGAAGKVAVNLKFADGKTQTLLGTVKADTLPRTVLKDGKKAPEMLPMVVTANLAKGAVMMARRKSIVKKLNAIQNFGAMDILCTDKTGTLTQNKVILERHLDIHGNEEHCREAYRTEARPSIHGAAPVSVVGDVPPRAARPWAICGQYFA